MPGIEFKPRFCETCGEPKNKRIDGVDIIVRCSCDWEAGFHERLRATVHQDFWKNGLKTIKDYDPPLFKYGGRGYFKSLIKVQKAFTIKKLYEFCFKLKENDPVPGQKRFSLYDSMDHGRNLFIRGPTGSGRGSLMGYIKTFCAMRDISTTPNPADWSTFKSEVLQSEWNSKEADIAKILVAEQYQNVKLLTLENVRGEGQLNSTDRFPRRPFRGSNVIDSLLTKRTFQQGSMVFTSSEFVKEIGDTVGDKFPDILDSDHTSLILMFSPVEADALLDGLKRKIDFLRIELQNIEKKLSNENYQNDLTNDKSIENLEELLFLEMAFPITAWEKNSSDKTEPFSMRFKMSIQKDIERQMGLWPRKAIETYSKITSSNFKQTLAYEEGIKKAYQSAVLGCKELAYKMSPRELAVTGEMMSYACSDVNRTNKMMAEARKMRDLIYDQRLGTSS